MKVDILLIVTKLLVSLVSCMVGYLLAMYLLKG